MHSSSTTTPARSRPSSHTFPDDANLPRKITDKWGKYEAWLVYTSNPDAPIPGSTTLSRPRGRPAWHFGTHLRVITVGAWGTIPQSTIDDLGALGMSLDQTISALLKVDGILSAANYGIYRQRHANSATAPRAAAPGGASAVP